MIGDALFGVVVYCCLCLLLWFVVFCVSVLSFEVGVCF